MGTWKPQVDGALQDLRNDITTLRQQLGRVALNPILGLDSSTLQARAIPVALDGGGFAATEISDGSRGQIGHGALPQNRGPSIGDLSLTTPPTKDGIKEEITVVVLVHQPKNLDAAVSLALLHEEAMEIRRNREPRRTDGSFLYNKNNFRPLAIQATSVDKPATIHSAPRTPIPSEDKRGQESVRNAIPATSEDRVASLKSYRRSRGLCFVCGEKWAPGHKCFTIVQIHVVQEMLDAPGLNPMEQATTGAGEGGELLVISQAVVAGTDAPNTFRLLGQIQKQQVLMLIDSGSSHCFMNETIATQLKGVEREVNPIQVKIADGVVMTCNRELVGCEWWCQGATFKTDLKVLPLGGYDVIISMDWLQSHNPMGIDWVGKRLVFWDHGKLVQLKGLQAQPVECKEVEPGELLLLLQQDGVTDMVQIQCMEEGGRSIPSS
uniref:Uncharacterized protein n=1 Tax=Avena sativa TaxID=4498 RepID=A0ACD5VEF7_AVESA